jgi:hypothetical protein
MLGTRLTCVSANDDLGKRQFEYSATQPLHRLAPCGLLEYPEVSECASAFITGRYSATRCWSGMQVHGRTSAVR